MHQNIKLQLVLNMNPVGGGGSKQINQVAHANHMNADTQASPAVQILEDR